jgi:hypothetical protein
MEMGSSICFNDRIIVVSLFLYLNFSILPLLDELVIDIVESLKLVCMQ